MANGQGAAGLAAVAFVAALLGVLTLLIGWFDLLTGASEAVAGTIVALNRVVLGTILVPTAWGLVRGALWSRYLGIVAFGGLAIVQLLPLLAGATLAVPLAGVLLAGTCSLYLLVAPGAFGSADDDRPVDEDTNPHFFMR